MRWTGLATTSLAALAVAALVTLAVASLRSRAAEAAHPPSGQFLEIGGTRVHYVEKGEGPAVVLLHGAHGSLRDFTFDLVDRLAPRYRVIAFDRPGLGYSGRIAPYGRLFEGAGESPSDQAAHLAAAARRLGADRPIVVGHSMGGIVALAWALDHDPAAVVSIAGVAKPWPGELGWLYQVNGTTLGGALVPPLITAWAPRGLLADAVESTFAPQPAPPGYADHIGPRMPVRTDVFRANARQVNTLRPHVVEMEDRYGEMTLPIEIVHGTEDETVPLSVHSGPLAQQVPGANLTLLEGVGHMPHHVDPDAVVAAIDRAAARAGLR